MTRTSAKLADSAAAKKAENPQATRETVESIVIAVILAFLFRGFVAEAFVIPTGSMAPTLMGRHIDVRCPDCDYSYQTGASEENDDSGIVKVTYCPICRFPKTLDRARNPDERSFTGDRILVSKYEYELKKPDRWDVIVFKYPQNAKQNYIKRLVGLPNELVQIRHGDIYIGQYLFDISRSMLEANEFDEEQIREQFREADYDLSADAEFELIPSDQHPDSVVAQDAQAIWEVIDSDQHYLIRLPRSRMSEPDQPARVFTAPRIIRKPAIKERALLQMVYDTAYQGKLLVRARWPSRWQDRGASRVWEEMEPGIFTATGPDDAFAWIRYRHIYPSDQEWREMADTQNRPDTILREDGALISDYYAYNDGISSAEGGVDRTPGHHWVGDLAVEADLQVQSTEGEVAFDLVEAGVHYRCTIDVATGQATLGISDGSPFVAENGQIGTDAPTAKTKVRGPGDYTIRFVNADDQLRLWVDDEVVSFTDPTTYEPQGLDEPKWSPDDPGDLAPAGVGVRKAAVRIRRLKLLRDVYYVAETTSSSDYLLLPSDEEIQQLFRSPREWSNTTLFESRQMVEFVIGADQYFPLGDNSPKSADGRMWREPYFTEDMLIGKAMLIYWPHGWNRPIPFTPNFSRMRLIH